jgi:hypothetical protein
MWRHATGSVELARTRSDAEAHIQVANGAGVVNRISAVSRVVEGEPQEKEGSMNDREELLERIKEEIEHVRESIKSLPGSRRSSAVVRRKGVVDGLVIAQAIIEEAL